MDWTRLTIHGSSKRADVVLPSDQPVGSLLPRLLDLLEEPVDAPRVMVTADGKQLAEESTLAELDVPDGELVRLVPADEAPRPPEVSDLSRAVTDYRATRWDVWDLSWARRAAAPLLAAVAAWLAVGLSLTQQAIGVGSLTLVAAVAARRGDRWPRAATVALALGGSAVLGWEAARALDDGGATILAGAFGAYVAVALVAAATLGVAGRSRPALAGGLVALLTGLPLAIPAGRLGATGDVAAVVATGCVFLLGLVPTLAVTASGLAGAGERSRVSGAEGSASLAGTIVDAYAAWTWLVVALGAPLGASVAILVREDGPFAWWLALALAVVVLARTRLLPLAAQVVASGLVVAAGIVAALTRPDLPVAVRAAVPVVVAALVVLGCTRPLPEHVRARLRTWANTLELLAVVAVVPLLLGHLRIFGDLLKVFTR